MDSGLYTYTVYRPRDKAVDIPGAEDSLHEFVCRRQLATTQNGQPVVLHDLKLWARGETLEECREALCRKTPGLTCIGRQPQDDPTIVEVWL